MIIATCTLAMWFLALGENLLQLMRFGAYFKIILNTK